MEQQPSSSAYLPERDSTAAPRRLRNLPGAASPDSWIAIAIALTALNYVACEALRPITGLRGHINIKDTVASAGLFFELGFLSLFVWIVTLAIRREKYPLSVLRVTLTRDRLVGFIALGVLANLNLSVLGEVKSQLNQLVGFSADAKLSSIDRLFFFGTDPWRTLRWLDHPYLAEAYHFGWIGWITAALVYVGIQTPSSRKNVLLIAYFALWTVGPLIHLLIPAAGPLFFEQLELGDTFAEIPQPVHTRFIEAYLWEGYQTRTMNYAGGISAMPSLHIATMTWAAIAFHQSRLFPVAVVTALYIFAASILTGWHYAIDGVIGAAVAFAVYALSDRLFSASKKMGRSLNELSGHDLER